MRVLIVEDDDDQRAALREVFEDRGWRVDLADDGIAALGRLRHVAPDVVVLDLGLPRLDGGAVLRRLDAGATGRGFAVIVATAADVPPDVRASADAIVSKPFAPEDLFAVAEELAFARRVLAWKPAG